MHKKAPPRGDGAGFNALLFLLAGLVGDARLVLQADWREGLALLRSRRS